MNDDKYIKTDMQQADLFTKSLDKDRFNKLITKFC